MVAGIDTLIVAATRSSAKPSRAAMPDSAAMPKMIHAMSCGSVVAICTCWSGRGAAGAAAAGAAAALGTADAAPLEDAAGTLAPTAPLAGGAALPPLAGAHAWTHAARHTTATANRHAMNCSS